MLIIDMIWEGSIVNVLGGGAEAHQRFHSLMVSVFGGGAEAHRRFHSLMVSVLGGGAEAHRTTLLEPMTENLFPRCPSKNRYLIY